VDSSKRILNQLEHGRAMERPTASRQGRRHLVYALGVVGAVVVLAAGVVGLGTDAQQRSTAVLDPVALAVAPAPPLAESRQEDERLAAAIVNEPLERHVANQSRAVTPGALPSTRSTPARGAAGMTPATRPRLAKASGTRAGDAGTAAAAAASAPTQASARAERRDSDVALLTALMAHANGEDTAERPLAANLRHCARLGPNEAALCHARACTGRWGRERACRITVRE